MASTSVLTVKVIIYEGKNIYLNIRNYFFYFFFLVIPIYIPAVIQQFFLLLTFRRGENSNQLNIEPISKWKYFISCYYFSFP